MDKTGRVMYHIACIETLNIELGQIMYGPETDETFVAIRTIEAKIDDHKAQIKALLVQIKN
jgi:hypothetical protein